MLGVVTASFHAQVKHLLRPEKKVTKSISLIVSKNNYDPRIYHSSNASVELILIKISKHSTDTIMQKQYPEFRLKKLASFAETFNQTIEIPDVVDRKERILVHYIITYKSKGSVLQIKQGKLIPRKVTEDVAYVQI